jgi:hypothetical protein
MVMPFEQLSGAAPPGPDPGNAQPVPRQLRSREIWREIEIEAGSGNDVFTAHGALMLMAASGTTGQHGAGDFLSRP